MGKASKGISGAASGAAAGSSFGPWGAGIGAGVGLLAGGLDTDGAAPQHVQQLDPAFVQSLYNQANGSEKTAADVKMKASFDQTLAQQVAAARAQRGVNPALLSRNVARMAQETNAKSAQLGEEMNLKNQDDARARYMQAIGMNQQVQLNNSKMDTDASNRNDARSGAMLNSIGAIGSTFATANAAKDQANPPTDNTVKGPINTSNYSLNDTPAPANLVPDYSLGADTSVKVPQYATATSDQRAKTKIKKIVNSGQQSNNDLVVTSDERQKDLIKNESLPQNGNMGQQNQTAMQPAGAAPMQSPMVAAQTAPTSATPAAPTQAPAAPPAPAPVPASQTALAQANTSLSKGGQINDLAMQDISAIAKPAEEPDSGLLAFFASEAKRQQRRGADGNPIESDRQLYDKFVNEWKGNNASKKADYLKQVDDAKMANAGVTNERAARLANFWTGTTAVNANDIAQRYAPKVTTPGIMNFQGAQQLLDAKNAANPNYVPTVTGYQSQASLTATSDERSKEGITKEGASSGDSMNPKSFLDKLTAYSYEYKQGQKNNPQAGPGRHLSVMAQDLEAAGPVGKSMVKTDPTGVKQVDYGKGFGAILAAQVQLNERLAALETKKAK